MEESRTDIFEKLDVLKDGDHVLSAMARLLGVAQNLKRTNCLFVDFST